jgi:hypothetical protein
VPRKPTKPKTDEDELLNRLRRHLIRNKYPHDVDRLVLGFKRVGQTPAARLKWLLAFKDQDLNLLHPQERAALGYDLQALIGQREGLEIWTAIPTEEQVSVELVTEIQAEVRKGFARLFSDKDRRMGRPIGLWGFPPPEAIYLQRTGPLSAKRSNVDLVIDLWRAGPIARPNPKHAILYGILNTVREGHDLLRLCSECKAPFVPVRRQEYCSTKCSQKARDRRRKKNPK